MNRFRPFRYLTTLLLFAAVGINIHAQNLCNPDDLAPIAVCVADLTIEYDASQDFTISASSLDDGSSDNCTPLEDLAFFISQDPNLTQPPATTDLTFAAGTSGTFDPTMWVVDTAGLFSTCWASITLLPNTNVCDPDLTAPIAVCDLNVTVQHDGLSTIAVSANLFDDGSWDACTDQSDLSLFVTLDLSLTNPPSTPTLNFPPGTTGNFTVALWVVDEAGLTNTCVSTLQLISDTACNPDVNAPIAVCNSSLAVTNIPGEDFVITPEMIDEASNDNCTSDEDLQFFLSLDPSLTAPPSTEVLTFPANTNDIFTVHLWVVDEAGLYSSCFTQVQLQSFQFIFGNVFVDDNNNCILDPEEVGNGISTYPVRYTLDQGVSYTVQNPNEEGVFGFSLNTSGSSELTIEVLLPLGTSSSCPTAYTFDLPLDDNPIEINFPVQLANDCDNMMVDISTPFLRRCFPVVYTANYCNASNYDIDNVELSVVLPPEMILDDAGMAYTSLGNNEFLFDLGTVPAGYCDQIPLTVILDCTVPLGATKCVQASIIPNNCLTAASSWSGASLVAEATCDEGTGMVELSITNVGLEAMPEARSYLIVEDVIMYQYDPIQLAPGEKHSIERPANGSTWRIEMEQAEGHPSLSTPAAVVEGCGGFGTMGVFNALALPDEEPFLAIDCQEVIGSYDPNEKRAYPTGFSDENIIKANQSLEYHIHFQNTGTDTAFTVRLEDQLSEYLDHNSIQAGASSHPYRMELKEDGFLIFHFDNILLPDSTTNEPASHGFVQFRIQQLPDQPIGTVIENSVDIYFDFNDPIITNTVFHTIGEEVLSTSTTNIHPELSLSVAPNPFNDFTLFSFEGKVLQEVQFDLYDIYGRLVRTASFTGLHFQLQGQGLSPGSYFYRFQENGQFLANGKIIVY
ncbi:MAG: T9SS type A sorting domain-containing protein [Bacteroidota bacterium]